MRTLLIEDNDDDVRLIREMLTQVEGESFELDTAKRLSVGLKKVAAHRPDAVLLDLGLPDSVGFATFETVHAAAADMPIVVFSGSTDIEIATRAVSQGAQDYLVKGQVDATVIARSLRYAVERKAAEKKINQQQQRLAALNRITAAITSTLDPAKVLSLLAQSIDTFLPYSAGTVWLATPEGHQFKRVACWNIDEKKWKRLGSDGIPPNLQPIIDGRRGVYIGEIQTDPNTANTEFFKKERIVSCLTLPLLVHNELLGMIAFMTREKHEFPQDELDSLQNLAGHAAIAIHNSQLHAKTQSQAEELAKTNRAMADMTAMIAHDLRAPLMNMIGFADMMADGFAGPVLDEQKNWLSKIAASGRSMFELVKDFLDLSKIEAGHLNLKSEPFKLPQLIEDVIENFRLSARRKGVQLIHCCDANLPALVADRRRLEQVLNNLLSNAITFSHAGGIVEVRAARENRSGLRIEVTDQGVGIAAKELAQLFQKYKTANTDSPPEQSTGLGLVICKTIVEAHRGKIWIESTEGSGSKISISLPNSN